jgi:MtN3 and saliva related transmembrane protein
MDTVSIIGFVAALGATASNVPQVLKTWRTSETGDLSFKMLAMLTVSLALWAIYGFLRDDWIIVASNTISASMAGYLTIAKLRYG